MCHKSTKITVPLWFKSAVFTSGPEVVKLIRLIKTTILKKNKDVLAYKLTDVLFIMLINVKMPTIVGILTFMSMIKFMLSTLRWKSYFGMVLLQVQVQLQSGSGTDQVDASMTNEGNDDIDAALQDLQESLEGSSVSSPGDITHIPELADWVKFLK